MRCAAAVAVRGALRHQLAVGLMHIKMLPLLATPSYAILKCLACIAPLSYPLEERGYTGQWGK
jgi:hypothetical protein